MITFMAILALASASVMVVQSIWIGVQVFKGDLYE